MFTGPEYASYIALCRELRLERDWVEGDWYWSGDASVIARWDNRPDYGGEEPFWLPRLDQWLAMLEEAGATSLYWQRLPSNGWYRVYLDPEVRNAGPHGPQPDADLMSGGPTREEAAASLWRAMTGRVLRKA